MKILKWIVFILIGLVAFVMIIALFLPKRVKIVAETEINVPVYKVYYSLATFTDRALWDPWVTKDSTARVTIEPIEGYVGTIYRWTSKNSGSGEMIIDSVENNMHISLTLSFAGMNQKAKVWHDLVGIDGKTQLSWGFSQDASYPVGRVFMVFMKGKLQEDYNEGLANLKQHLEGKGIQMSSLSKILVERIPPFYAIVAEGKGKMEEFGNAMPGMYATVTSSIQTQGLQIIGPPFNHYIYFDESTGISVFEVGFPVDKSGTTTAEVKAVTIPGFAALEALHTGPYSEFGVSYALFMKHISENKIEVDNGTWEFYLTDPMTVPDEMKWQTLIVFPLK